MIEEIAIIIIPVILIAIAYAYNMGYKHGKKSRVIITMPGKINLEEKV